MVVEETGGLHGVRHHDVIQSVELLPLQDVFGKELYPEIFLKAAVYARTILMNHPFVDGNKRTGMTAAMVFLEDNGFIFEAKKGEMAAMAIRIVVEKLPLEEIAAWLKAHSKKNHEIHRRTPRRN